MTILNGQSIKCAIALWTALRVCGGQEVTSRPIFLGREVISKSEKIDILKELETRSILISDLNEAAVSPSTYDPFIRSKYDDVNAERSLLIHDCSNFCGDPDFSFPSMFKKAVKAGMSDPGRASQDWYDSAANTIPSFEKYLQSDGMNPWDGKQPEGAPFQLLAIVNRLDFGTTKCEPGDSTCSGSALKWRNAEMHFVYGLVQNKLGANFTLIIEFVLPPLSWRDFRSLEGAWADLGKLKGDAYLKQLKKVLSETPPAISARLRTNSETSVGGGGPWFLAQWEFTKDGPKPSSLTDQLWIECTRADHTFPFNSLRKCMKADPTACNGFAGLWDAYAKVPAATHLTVPEAQLAMTQCYNADGPTTYYGMDFPSGKCSSETDCRARNIVALQQCSFCHGPEANNSQFTHIHNRNPQSSVAELSDFLKGKKCKPSFKELNHHDPKALFVATVTLNTPGCPGTVKRYFHDLARRSAFLAAVLVQDQDHPPDEVLTKIIQEYGPDFVH